MRQDIRSPQRWAVFRRGEHWLRQMWRLCALAVLLVAGLPGLANAQDATFKTEELDQMLAPIALYPDSLLAQVLMASTYPADFKEAVDWSKAHPDAKGDDAINQVEGKDWEPSVKSLAAFPQVLAMMGAKPDDVQRLGDAFLADPARVMDRVQFLRKKAQEAGNLKTNEQQKVTTETQENKQVIIVEPAQPNTAYVPVYQPTVVYGSWWYPSYPPYYYPPPPYYYPGAAFVGGMIWGAAVVGIANGLWGGCNWGGGNVNVNVNKYNNVNVNNKRTTNNNSFNHDASRRGDVPYRDSKSREQYGQKAADGAKGREDFRGKDGGARDSQRANAESALKSRGADPAAGREALQGADRDKANAAVRDSSRDAGRGGAGASTTDRGGAGVSSRDAGGGGGASNRASSSNAMSGARDSGASRADASRGQSSRSSMSSGASRSGGGGGGGARGGGGGGRGGGGRR
jgi:Protein of unknown function (DUF3300)